MLDIIQNWPVNDSDEVKTVYHQGMLGKEEVQHLSSIGWEVDDLRQRKSDSDGDRGTKVKDFLEGVRMGTIAVDTAVLRSVEIECKIYGLTSTKQINSDDGKNLSKKSIDDLLSFGLRSNQKNDATSETSPTGNDSRKGSSKQHQSES